MKATLENTELRLTGHTRDHSPRKQAEEVLIDLETHQPIVRDLRYHHFVAHQRERYFLNQNCDH